MADGGGTVLGIFRKTGAPAEAHTARPSASPWLRVEMLIGDRVALEVLSHSHAGDRCAAAADGGLHRRCYTNAPSPERVDDEIERRLELHAGGDWLRFATINGASSKALGMSRDLNAAARFHRVEGGGAGLAKSARRSGINVASKLLLFEHAFEALRWIAVQLRTNTFNLDSRQAIVALGAKLDGVLRNRYDAFDTTCV